VGTFLPEIVWIIPRRPWSHIRGSTQNCFRTWRRRHSHPQRDILVCKAERKTWKCEAPAGQLQAAGIPGDCETAQGAWLVGQPSSFTCPPRLVGKKPKHVNPTHHPLPPPEVAPTGHMQ